MQNVFAFVLLFLVGPLLGQGWVDRTGPNGPAPRYGHAMCYDPVHGYTLMVGSLNPGGNWVNETWSWDGAAWTARGGAPTPTPANYLQVLTMCLHAPSNEVILLVRQDQVGGNLQLMSFAWSGTAWVARGVTGIACFGYSVALAAAYDPVRQECVVFSHNDPGRVAIWNGAQWSLRNVTSAATNMYGNGSLSLAWDPTVQRLLLTGSSPVRFFEWTGFGWNQRLPGNAPTAAGAMAADSWRQRLVMCDEDPSLQPNHTWVITNGTCTRLTTPIEPSLRSQSAMAFDSARGVCVLFGGFNGYAMGDTWEFDLGPLASFTAYGTGCVGSRGVPSLTAQGTSTPRLGTTFTAQVNGLPWTGPAFLFVGLSDTSYGGTPLPFNLNVLGAPGCNLLTSCEGLYLLTNVLGSAQWSFPVPPFPGASFYTQVFPLDPVNALGLTASNGGHGVIGL